MMDSNQESSSSSSSSSSTYSSSSLSDNAIHLNQNMYQTIKLVNKKYNVSNSDILKMLHRHWRSRHCVSNIKKQGDDKVKMDRRRLKKNSRTMDKKKEELKQQTI
ncbi:unnamed protein product [Rhizophagus irregularis]|nr:unnamed protein product [Rhizophagus irregularis]